MSICSSVARDGVVPGIVDGDVDRPELAADAALRSRGMSVMSVGCGLVMSSLGEVAARIDLPQRPRIVVVAVDERHLLVQGFGAATRS